MRVWSRLESGLRSYLVVRCTRIVGVELDSVRIASEVLPSSPSSVRLCI